MDVPTQATRRIERYGVLALILFLTTFGVLYLWDAPTEEDPGSDTVIAGRAVSGYHPRSTARPVRPRGSDDLTVTRSALPPLAIADPEQRHLGMRQGSRSVGQVHTEEISSPSRGTLNEEDRNKMVRHFRRTETVGEGAFDGPATDVSVSGYSGRWIESGTQAQRDGAPKKKEMEYLVKSGDCLSKVAERELGSVKHLARLMEVNGLSSDSLRVGQRLILPHIGEVAAVRGADIEPEFTPAPDPKTWEMVTVQEGDSLWRIAARVLDDGNRYDEIMAWNKLKSETLQPGTQLRIQRSGGAALTIGGTIR